MKGTAIITGADGGMGTEITRAVATAGYRVIMLCYTRTKGEERMNQLVKSTGNPDIEVIEADLSSMARVRSVTDQLLGRLPSVELLMNNAGTMCTHFSRTPEGFERTVAVNYLAPYLLTRRLLPLTHSGTRIVNMVSCTYAIGSAGPHFFENGSESRTFWRIPIYGNTKYALWMFTHELSLRLKEQGVTVNAADPGVVSTDIIRMDMWFDPLTDLFFRPLIRTPRQGADTAIRLLLDNEKEGVTGGLFASGTAKPLQTRFTDPIRSRQLWERTEDRLKDFL